MVSLKGRFRFRLATTSFIYPATWAGNVRRLAPLVDEIELLFFESAPGSLPTAADIRELALLGRDLAVRFNVHLPLDVYLCHSDAARHRRAVSRLVHLLSLCGPLAPTSYTLHLGVPPAADPHPGWQSWRERCRLGIEALLATGIESRLLAVETLIHPPFERSRKLVAQYDLSVCLDMGHLLMRGQDPVDFLRRFEERVAVVHLHGVADGRDHLGLDRLPAAGLDRILEALRAFTGTVSLEVFSRAHLQASLASLEKRLSQPAP